MLQSSDMIYNSKFLSKSKSSTGNRIATSISNFGFCETIIYSFSCTCEDKSNCDQCSECVSVSVSYEYCGNGGSGDVGSGDSGDINIGFGSGGEDSGIYIPNPYTGDADLNNPDFALAIQVSDFVETITNSNFALKSLMEDNSWLYPNIVQFMRDNGHEVSQVNKDAVVFALTNVIPVFKLNLPDWTFTNINLFHYDSFNLLLQSQENVNFTNQIVTKIQQNPTLYTSTKPFVIEKQINDTQLNPCLKGIMEKLKMATNSDIANVMAKLDATNEYNLTMKMGTVKPGNYAATTKVSKNNYLVTVTQNDFTTASKLYRATSLLHETIHAFMLSVVDDYNTYPTNAPFTDFPELFKIYVSKINNVDNAEIAQHEDMANKYVDAIASALEEYQTSTTGIPSSLADKQVFLDMAWSGLQNTDVFDTKFPLGSANRTRILARIGAELNGVYSQGQYAVGKPCN